MDSLFLRPKLILKIGICLIDSLSDEHFCEVVNLVRQLISLSNEAYHSWYVVGSPEKSFGFGVSLSTAVK